jgi:hypothetical protein
VIHGARLTLEKGRALSVFGQVTRAVEGERAGEKVPEVRADFVMLESP